MRHILINGMWRMLIAPGVADDADQNLSAHGAGPREIHGAATYTS
jgi:hypothetical protein